MKIRPNIGILNALIRITFGLTIVAWSTSKLVKHPWRDSYLFACLMGAMKVAEGIVRYCPLTALFERYQDDIKEMVAPAVHNMEEETTLDGEEILPYNPT